MKRIKISHLKCNEYKWSWVYTTFDGRHFDYCTNSKGAGLFYYDCQGDFVQSVGTCDFTLSNYSLSGARKKLNRYFR